MLEHIPPLEAPAQWIYRFFWKTADVLLGRTARLFHRYLETTAVRKLHLGCSGNYLAGWLNTDLRSNLHRARLDATRRFPFADSTFHFIFPEHMIEHIPYADA